MGQNNKNMANYRGVKIQEATDADNSRNRFISAEIISFAIARSNGSNLLKILPYNPT